MDVHLKSFEEFLKSKGEKHRKDVTAVRLRSVKTSEKLADESRGLRPDVDPVDWSSHQIGSF